MMCSGIFPGFSMRCFAPNGMKVDSFSSSRNTSSLRVMRAVPDTTIQCSARWWCSCSDIEAPGFTESRFTW